METSPPPVTPPSQGTSIPTSQKKGLGTGAKIGIGCGVVVLLGIVAAVIAVVMLGGKLKQFGEDAQKNPTRAAASLMVNMSGGEFKMVAEDEVNKRYTVKDSKGNLTTIYWDETKKEPVTISGDFSAIPTAPVSPAPVEEPAN